MSFSFFKKRSWLLCEISLVSVGSLAARGGEGSMNALGLLSQPSTARTRAWLGCESICLTPLTSDESTGHLIP